LPIVRGKLEARLDRTLNRSYRSPVNRRPASHPSLGAANYRAEPAIRLMVVTRKAGGGNRAGRAAHSQSVPVSILQTRRRQLRPARDSARNSPPAQATSPGNDPGCSSLNRYRRRVVPLVLCWKKAALAKTIMVAYIHNNRSGALWKPLTASALGLHRA